MAKPIGERAFDRQSASCAHTRNLLQSAIMKGLLQLFERVGIELVVNVWGKLGPDAGMVWNNCSGSSVPNSRSS